MKLDVAWAFLSWWDDWNMFMIVENAKWTQMMPHVTWIGFWRYRCIHWSQILTWRRSKLKHDYKQEVAQAQSVSLKPLQPNMPCPDAREINQHATAPVRKLMLKAVKSPQISWTVCQVDTSLYMTCRSRFKHAAMSTALGTRMYSSKHQ